MAVSALGLSPRGSMEPYALTISQIKKALSSLIYEKRNIMTASCLWALSGQEKASIRAYGFCRADGGQSARSEPRGGARRRRNSPTFEPGIV